MFKNVYQYMYEYIAEIRQVHPSRRPVRRATKRKRVITHRSSIFFPCVMNFPSRSLFVDEAIEFQAAASREKERVFTYGEGNVVGVAAVRRRAIVPSQR